VSHLVLSAVLIILTTVILDWLESRRSRIARAPRRRREQLGTRPAMQLPEHGPARHHRGTAAKRGAA